MNRRGDQMNGAITSDMATDFQPINGGKRLNGRPKYDELDSATHSSASSKDRATTRPYNKMLRGPDRSTVPHEAVPSIEDAVYIYRTIMNSGSRPPIFLQRSLVYLQRLRKAKKPKARKELEGQVQTLSSMASVCSQVRLSLSGVLNVKLAPTDKKELTIDFYLLKNCYKRRKTDVTTKEKFIKRIRLVSPWNLEAANHCLTLDTGEISSDVGSHHMSACYLKAKVAVSTEKKSGHPATKKSKKKYPLEAPEPKYKLKEYESMLLLHSGGKSSLPSGKQTLFLHEVRLGLQTAPQYMDWNDLSTGPQIVLDSLQLNQKRMVRCSPPKSPVKSTNLTITQTPVPPTSPIPLQLNASGSEKLYFVLQYKGAPQTTVQVGYSCPFCLKNTRPSTLVLLLKHLRLCHSRLLFLYKETDGEPAIIVTVNTYYDGSYCGNPLDIIPSLRHGASMCEPFKRREPMRCTPYTEVLNIKADRRPLTLEEFAKPEPLPLISSSSSLLGHNSCVPKHSSSKSSRLYYRSIINQPVLSNDFDMDSDGEDTEWTRVASSRLIDEFIDVNKGEKELMKLWNNFISRHPIYISDTQMEGACLKFISEHSEHVSSKLRNNFLCHVTTLYDAGVLQTKHVTTIIDALPKKSSTGTKNKTHINGHHSLARVKSEPSK